ncbi:hypothetical protein AB0D78_15740 [Streptomyces avermitilis]|uniref:hypothetical protein n=1 Tax=Streptomyces avermitilis TaxID=33903 RepID=UPI0033EAAF5F
MPEHASILQLTGVTVLALAMGVWIAILIRLLRGGHGGRGGYGGRGGRGVRHRGEAHRRRDVLRALPRQRRAGPALESVDLTPAERDAFAGLVRQFSDGRS